MTVLKALVWSGFALAVVGLLGILFNLAPYALAPFYLNWPLQSPGSIEGGISDVEAKRRVRALRKITASPQAAATSVDDLTVIGMTFDDKRDTGGASATGAASGAALPFPVTLDLANTAREGIVTIAEQAVAWTIVPPPEDQPQAVLGLESRLFPTLRDAPAGVLAGFRIASAGGRSAKPVNPETASSGDLRSLCRSLAQWATHFSVPLDKVAYLLVENPKTLSFDGEYWISDGRVVLQIEGEDLRNGCERYYAEAWRR